MKIEIHTYDNMLAFDLLGASSAKFDQEVEIPGNATLIYKGSQVFKSIGLPEIAEFVINFGSGVASGLVASWLYSKLKGEKIEKLIIERKEIQIEEGEIRKIIEERTKIE